MTATKKKETAATTATKKEKATTTNDLHEEGNIDKIRDILFGVQVRDFEERFLKLEKHFDKEIEKTQTKTQKRISSLEETLKKELGALTEKLYVEQDSRSDAIKGVIEDLKITSSNFEEEISKINEKNTKSESELRKNIVEQSKSLTADIQKRQNEILVSLEKESEELQDSKTDREALARMFTEMGQRLTGETKETKAK